MSRTILVVTEISIMHLNPLIYSQLPLEPVREKQSSVILQYMELFAHQRSSLLRSLPFLCQALCSFAQRSCLEMH